MNATISEISSTLRQLDIEIPQDAIKASFDEKFKKYSKQVKMNGFRPGKVPRNVILARFGDSIRAEAIDSTIDTLLRDEFQKADIQPVTQGKLEDFKDDKEGPITFKVTVEVDPEVVAEGYTDFGVKAAETSVEAFEIEDEIANVLKSFAEEKDADRASAQGDVVRGKYLSLNIDGVDRDVPENPEFRVEIGASPTPDFDKGLVGLKVGDETEIDFVFPADYEAEELRGLKALYKLKVDKVAELSTPSFDEETLKKLEVASEEELRERLEKNLSERKKANARSDAHAQIIEKILEKFTFEVPEARISQYVMRSLDKEEISDEELAAGRDEAVKEIRKYRILDAISTKEAIKVKQADVDTYVTTMAGYYGIPFEDLKNNLRSSGRMVQIREELKLEKTLNFLIGEVEEEAKQEA